MIAEAVRRSALADYADRFAALSASSGGGLSIRELPFVTQVNLRADANDDDLMQRLAAAVGFVLPLAPNTIASMDDRRAIWLAPDEWLVVGPDGQRESLEHALRGGLNGQFGSIVDVSANRTMLEIRGARALELLAHGLSIDLDARSFPPGHCAQTLLAKAQVIVERSTESAFQLHARSSFATYVGEWLVDAIAGLDQGGSVSHLARQVNGSPLG